MNGAAAVLASTRSKPRSRKISSRGNIHHFRLVFTKSQKSAKKPGSEASWRRCSFSVTRSVCSMIGSVGIDSLGLILAEVASDTRRLELGRPVALDVGTASGEGISRGESEEGGQRGDEAVVDQAHQDDADHVPDRPGERHGAEEDRPD